MPGTAELEYGLSVGAEAGHHRSRVAAACGAPAWYPVDVLALINQIAMTWAGQPEIAAAAAGQAVDPSIAARRAALVAAVERMFPRPS